MGTQRKKILSGLVWTYAERTLAQIVSLIVTIVLARLVTPTEYGVISICTVFIVLADTFAVSGMGSALIQKKDADQLDYSSVFYFNIFFSLIIYIGIFLLARPISLFYDMPLLIWPLRIMAIRIPVAAINSVQQAYVSKTLQFKKFFYATLIGTVVSGLLGVLFAYSGFGTWALVIQFLSNACIDTVVLWITVRWRPTLEYSSKRMKQLFTFGWKVLASSLLISIYSNIQDLIIGKRFSSSDLAFSSKGRQFPSLIATNINTSLGKVLFPVLAEKQNDVIEVKQMTRKSICIGTYLLTPLLFGLAAIAPSFVILLLTEAWSPCIPYMQIMCFVFLLQPIQTSSIQAIKALGRSDSYLRLELLKKVFGMVVLLVTILCFNSILAIFVGSLIAECFSTIINFPINNKLFKYTIKEQIKDILPPFVIASVMFSIVYMMNFLGINIGLKMILQILVGGMIYFTISVLTKNQNAMYIFNLVKKRGSHAPNKNCN